MQLTIEIPNKNIAEKVLWFLEHLKNDGVKIIQNNLDNNELSSIKTALKEVELIEDGSLKHTETLDELIEKLEK